MNVRRFTMHFGYSAIAALVLMSTSARADERASGSALAVGDQHADHMAASKSATGLLKVVRESTERFRDVSAAEAEGYKLMFGCVSGPDYGAMGLHYVNMSLVLDGELDPTRPEIVIYEPTANGRLRLIGADFLIFADAWHAKNPATTPDLMGQLLHLFEAPNRFGLPPFYTLHVWAWKDNPTGTYVNWHSKVSCDAFSGQNP
jgi:hypothetical protein